MTCDLPSTTDILTSILLYFTRSSNTLGDLTLYPQFPFDSGTIADPLVLSDDVYARLPFVSLPLVSE